MSTRVAGAEAGRGRVGGASRGSAPAYVHALARTDHDHVLLVLRATLALVIFPHGAQKLTGWFGGPGFTGTMAHLTGEYHLPWLIALLVVLIEFFAPLALALGVLSRLAAAAIASVMIGAALTQHTSYFFMNWFGNQAGEGFEYHLLAVGLAIAIMAYGGGAFSLDRVLTRQQEQQIS